MLVHPSGVDASGSALRFLSTRLTKRRRALGTRWRRLSGTAGSARPRPSPYRPHLYPARGRLRHDCRLPLRHRGRRSCWPYSHPLSPRPSRPRRRRFVILDGTLLPTGPSLWRNTNVQVIADPAGLLLWASAALPGAVHDVRAVRENGIIDALTEAGSTCWAHMGYRGAGGTVRASYWEPLGEPVHGQAGGNRSRAGGKTFTGGLPGDATDRDQSPVLVVVAARVGEQSRMADYEAGLEYRNCRLSRPTRDLISRNVPLTLLHSQTLPRSAARLSPATARGCRYRLAGRADGSGSTRSHRSRWTRSAHTQQILLT